MFMNNVICYVGSISMRSNCQTGAGDFLFDVTGDSSKASSSTSSATSSESEDKMTDPTEGLQTNKVYNTFLPPAGGGRAASRWTPYGGGPGLCGGWQVSHGM